MYGIAGADDEPPTDACPADAVLDRFAHLPPAPPAQQVATVNISHDTDLVSVPGFGLSKVHAGNRIDGVDTVKADSSTVLVETGSRVELSLKQVFCVLSSLAQV